MNQYTEQLVEFARELPQLQHDMQNASTQNALWLVCQKTFNILQYVLHHAIVEAYQGARPGAAPATPPAQSPIPPAFSSGPTLPSVGMLPPPNPITQPGLAPTQAPGIPGIAPSGVAEVVITPQGTRVIPPIGGQAVTLPPGSAVDLTGMGYPPVPPPAPPGVAQVVLPPGGAMTADCETRLPRLPEVLVWTVSAEACASILPAMARSSSLTLMVAGWPMVTWLPVETNLRKPAPSTSTS